MRLHLGIRGEIKKFRDFSCYKNTKSVTDTCTQNERAVTVSAS